MVRAEINEKLKQIIIEAQALNIPVPQNINNDVFINARPKKRFGCCKLKDDVFTIEISEFVLKCSEKSVKNILAHELLHTCKGCFEHGQLWKCYAEKMNAEYGYNIKRTSSFEELGLERPEESCQIKYIIRCKKCGREYPRQRYTCVMKKLNAYRCNCGGKLELIKLK